MHVLKIAEMEECVSIQATLLNIIDNDMEVRNMDHIELEGYGAEREEVEEEEETIKDETVKPLSLKDYNFNPPEEPITPGKPLGGHIELEPIKAIINEKPVEPEEEDDEFEI
jgi:hypothetical protein